MSCFLLFLLWLITTLSQRFLQLLWGILHWKLHILIVPMCFYLGREIFISVLPQIHSHLQIPTCPVQCEFSTVGCYLICGLTALLQGTQIVFVERKWSIIIHPFPWSVLVILVGREALNLAVLMPRSSTKLQRNHSFSWLWEKKSMKQTCIDWFRQRFSHSISKNQLWAKAGCSFEQTSSLSGKETQVATNNIML